MIHSKLNNDGILVIDCMDYCIDDSPYRTIPGLWHLPKNKKDGHYLAVIQCGNCFQGAYLYVPQEMSIAEYMLDLMEKSPNPHPYPQHRTTTDGVCYLCKRPFVKQPTKPETNEKNV